LRIPPSGGIRPTTKQATADTRKDKEQEMSATETGITSPQRAGLVTLLAAALLVALPNPGAEAACPNEAIREAQGASVAALPDCMALEMISPPQKGSQPVREPHLSADGSRARFRTQAVLAGTPGNLDISGDPYLATRTASGWVTSATAQAGIFRGWDSFANAKSFTPDFSRWFQLGGTYAQFQGGIGRAFQGQLGAPFAPLSPLLVPVGGDANDVVRMQISELQGASADHSHLYFNPGESLDHKGAYLPGDPVPAPAFLAGSVSGSDYNVYVALLNQSGEPTLELLARDRFGKAWGGNCGARLGGVTPDLGTAPNEKRNQGAISADGSRVYFSTRPTQPATGDCDPAANEMRIFVREESVAGPEIEALFASECDRVSPPCSSADGDDLYQGASADQSKVYFTTNRQLADTDLDGGSTSCSTTTAVAGCDLYLYDADLPVGQRLIQVSAGEDPTPGEGANLYNGITAISADGARAYFVAEGVLSTDPNSAGDTAQLGQPNLYLYENESELIAFIGTVDPDDGGFNGGQSDLWGSSGILALPALGDGHLLVFTSEAQLTADDSDGTGRDIFRYDAVAGTLVRVSKAGPGGADNGAFDVGPRKPRTLGTDYAELDRWASEDAETIVFETAEALLPEDENGIADSYLWRAGQLYLLPGNASNSVLSHDGSTVAFITAAQLLPQDGDSARDAYALREGGGYPIAPAAIPCVGEACQGPAPSLPAAARAASSSLIGKGNVKPNKRCPKGKRQVKRRGKARCVKRRARHNKNRRASREQGGRR
jgi:hypothetical protein